MIWLTSAHSHFAVSPRLYACVRRNILKALINRIDRERQRERDYPSEIDENDNTLLCVTSNAWLDAKRFFRTNSNWTQRDKQTLAKIAASMWESGNQTEREPLQNTFTPHNLVRSLITSHHIFKSKRIIIIINCLRIYIGLCLMSVWQWVVIVNDKISFIYENIKATNTDAWEFKLRVVAPYRTSKEKLVCLGITTAVTMNV